MKRRRTAQEQKLADDAGLLRWWKAWHREQHEAVLARPHGAVLGELARPAQSADRIRARHRLDGNRFRHAADRAARGQR